MKIGSVLIAPIKNLEDKAYELRNNIRNLKEQIELSKKLLRTREDELAGIERATKLLYEESNNM